MLRCIQLQKMLPLKHPYPWAFSHQALCFDTSVKACALVTSRGALPGWGYPQENTHCSHEHFCSRDQSTAKIANLGCGGKGSCQVYALRICWQCGLHGISRVRAQAMLPIWFNRRQGKISGSNQYTVGAMADSYFEYLLKMWLLHQKQVLPVLQGPCLLDSSCE